MAYKASAAFAMALFAVNLKAQWPIAMATLKNAAFYRSEEMQARAPAPHPPLPSLIAPWAPRAPAPPRRDY
eukprot:386920-Prymnesium_polylepis.1